MRFYTVDEVVLLSKYFNGVLLNYEPFKNVALSSTLSSKDLCKRNVMTFKDYKEKYILNCKDYYDVYKNMFSSDESIRPDENILEKNLSESEFRYPIIILCNNIEKKDNVPDMIHFTELMYTLIHFDDDDLKVIVIDKMIKPISKKLLDKVKKYYNIQDYDYNLYK